jgi:hypothetical protein
LALRPSLFVLALPFLALVGPVGASSADLLVTGSIAPAATCAMTLGTNNVIELGAIRRVPTEPTKLDTQRIKMFITCSTAQRYALLASSASSSGDRYDFGLVSDSGKASAGSLYIRFDNASAHIDGQDGYYTMAVPQADLETAAWGPSTFSVVTIPNGSHALGFVTADGSSAAPSFIKNFDTYLLVEPTIKPVNELDLRDELAFSGELGFEIRYF